MLSEKKQSEGQCIENDIIYILKTVLGIYLEVSRSIYKKLLTVVPGLVLFYF